MCKVCKVDSETKRCTGCYMVWYCGPKCQLVDWTDHKAECKISRNQFMSVALVKEITSVRHNISKKICVNKIGDLPSKGHFVVKVQTTIGDSIGRDPLLIYNRDNSLCGKMHQEEQQKVFDMLVKRIWEGGYNGLKGYFYAIYSETENSADRKTKAKVIININPVRILPLENW